MSSPSTADAPISRLQAALLADDDEALLALLPELDEAQREVAGATAPEVPAPPVDDDNRWTEAERLARIRHGRCWFFFHLGTAGPEEVADRGGLGMDHVTWAEVRSVLAGRSPQWRAAFVGPWLRGWAREREVSLFGPFWWINWDRYRRACLEGLFDVPVSRESLVLMVRGLEFGDDIYGALLADPGLRDDEVWRLFAPADGVQTALLGSERFWDPSNTWSVALARLALDGHLDEMRLRHAVATASQDERLGTGHRRWYRRITKLLDEPASIPAAPTTPGAPPAGNRRGI